MSGVAAFPSAALFLEKETGHVFQADLANREVVRLTNTTIPAVQEVVWSPEGDELILRYVDETNTAESPQSFYAEIAPEEGGEGTLDGAFLDPGIVALTAQAGSAKIFYIQEVGEDAKGYVANFDGTGKREIFSSPVSEWLADWNSTGSIVLTTKPSAETGGYAYVLSQNGALVPLMQNVRGLTVSVNPERTHMLFARSEGNGVFLQSQALAEGEPVELGIHTLPEKCAWAGTIAYCGVPEQVPAAKYPDAWYQGTVSFSDAIWRIDAEFGIADRVYNPGEGGASFDVSQPKVSEDGNYLVFLNKKDSALWSLDLSRTD